MITAKAADGSGKKAVYTITGMKGVVKKLRFPERKPSKQERALS